jgi:hypothetical protein
MYVREIDIKLSLTLWEKPSQIGLNRHRLRHSFRKFKEERIMQSQCMQIPFRVSHTHKRDSLKICARLKAFSGISARTIKHGETSVMLTASQNGMIVN